MPGVADADRIRWVLFDLFGVIIKEGHLVRNLLYPLCKGVCNLSYEELEALYLKYRVGKISQTEFHSYVPENVVKEMFRRLEFDEEIVELMRSLRNAGIKIGVITNKPKQWGDRIIRALREKVAIDLIVSSGEVGVAKPDPRIYKIFLERSGARPEKVVYIDDKAWNLVSASKLGIRTVLYIREGVDFFAKSPKSLRDIILSSGDEPPLD